MGDQIVRLFFVAIFGMVAAAMYGASRNANELPNDTMRFASYVGMARSIASEQGSDGATIFIQPSTEASASGYNVTLLRSRPYAGLSATAVAQSFFSKATISATSEGGAVQPPFVILVSPSDAASESAWAGAGLLTNYPNCVTGMTVTFSIESRSSTHSLSCNAQWQ